jgi:amidase
MTTTHPRRRFAARVCAPALAALACLAPTAQAASLDLRDMTISELSHAVKTGRVSCQAVIKGELDRIAALDDAGPALNAIITVNPRALADAAALDARLAAGARPREAHCLPVVLKDNIETAQVRTTFGSSLFADWTPAADAPLVASLRAKGAVVLAKGNLDDFAAAVYGASEIDGPMRNPYNQTRTVGGSSGGPAASVAAGYAPLAIGTDTGGSLRIPAAFNSVVTIRPTMGLVSRTGMSPRALTQDTAGPLARTVADAASGLDLIAGPDPADPLTRRGARHIPKRGYASYADGRRLGGVRIGVIREGIPLWGGIQSQVAALEEQAIGDLEGLGATVVDLPQAFVDALDTGFDCGDCLLDSGVIGFESRRDLTAFLGGLEPTPPVASFDALYNAGMNAGRYTDYAKESFDREAGVDLGDPATAASYATALDRQGELRAATVKLLADLDLDAVVYPTSTWFPDPLGVEQSGVFTRWSEQTGFPAISVPMGYGLPDDNPSDVALPASLELLGGPFDEPALIRIASAYERAAKRRAAPASTPATTVELRSRSRSG